MSSKSAAIWLVAGIAIGAIGASAFPIGKAGAQTSATLGEWVLGVDTGGQTSVAWRLNRMTGHMDICTATGGNPRCLTMPAPSN
jgi:hypothetical protein